MRLLFSVLAVLVLLPQLFAQDFTQQMVAEERVATGLHKLSAEELAALIAVVERYKSGEVAAVKVEAEKRAVASAAGAKKGPSWVMALITLEKIGSAGANEDLESRLDGKLETFSGRKKFTLENGQVWQTTNEGKYAGPTLTNPKAIIRPGALGAFWLIVPEGSLRVKVTPLRLE